MKNSHAQVDAAQPSAPIVELSALEAVSRQNARTRIVDRWMVAAEVALILTCTALFALYVVSPEMQALVAP